MFRSFSTTVFDADVAQYSAKPVIAAHVTARLPNSWGTGNVTWGAPLRIDFLIALAALIFLAPLMIVVAAAVALTSGGRVLFAHERIGLGGRRFHCLKFRTMRSDGERVLAQHLAGSPAARAEWDANRKLRLDPRVTAIGAFLRKTSLDELPQLLNVLKGEMSIVGPRPIVAAESSMYRRYFHTYCAVRPGITGLWQISGRNDTSYRRRVACDVAYVRAKSMGTDLRIMAMTVPVILTARGAY